MPDSSSSSSPSSSSCSSSSFWSSNKSSSSSGSPASSPSSSLASASNGPLQSSSPWSSMVSSYPLMVRLWPKWVIDGLTNANATDYHPHGFFIETNKGAPDYVTLESNDHVELITPLSLSGAQSTIFLQAKSGTSQEGIGSYALTFTVGKGTETCTVVLDVDIMPTVRKLVENAIDAFDPSVFRTDVNTVLSLGTSGVDSSLRTAAVSSISTKVSDWTNTTIRAALRASIPWSDNGPSRKFGATATVTVDRKKTLGQFKWIEFAPYGGFSWSDGTINTVFGIGASVGLGQWRGFEFEVNASYDWAWNTIWLGKADHFDATGTLKFGLKIALPKPGSMSP